MKRSLLILMVLSFLSTLASDGIDQPVTNNHRMAFLNAYNQYPDIPKGLLEAVSFTNTRFNHITHNPGEEGSCIGLPKYYGVMGLILDGKNYFKNNLSYISTLTGFSEADMLSQPDINILAFAKAVHLLKQAEPLQGNLPQHYIGILKTLSELPVGSAGQDFAMDAHLYSVYSFLNNQDYQDLYGFPYYNINLEEVFGANNLQVLSSKKVIISDQEIKSASGISFKQGGGNPAPQSVDYGPALSSFTSCNYSSRNGTAVSAVAIHDIEGSYSGCISWFHNCNSNVSAHYVLRSSDGQITQMVLESNKAWHVGNENPYTIGLEHEGYVNQTGWYTTAMYTASAGLVRDICNSGYGINPLRTYYGPGCSGGGNVCGIGACTKIKGHQMFASQSHSDPGPNWNWAYYYKLINNSPTINTLTAASGNLYDSGGPSSNYTNDERILTKLSPTGATSITLTFSSFNTEANWDYLFIYDGSTTSAPLIGQYTGTNSPGTVTSSGGNLLIEFRSDCATTNPGWAASYTSNVTPPPVGDNVAPTTNVSTTGSWQTADFTATFTDTDNSGGSGIEKSFYQVIDFNGTEWRANTLNGFFADNFDYAVHPDWTVPVYTGAGTWSIVNNALTQTDTSAAVGNSNIYAYLKQDLSNRYLYNFSGKISGNGTNKRAGFHFFCDDASQTNRGNSYFVWFRLSTSKLEFYKVTNNVFSLVKDTTLATTAGQWYDYKIIYDRITGWIKVYRDNSYVGSWLDASPLATGEYISFRNGNSEFSVNELKVYRSRYPSVNVTVGAAPNNDIRFENPDPTTFSAKIKSICNDNAGNLSAIDYHNLNIDWTPPSAPALVNDGPATDIATTTSTTELEANWFLATDPNSDIARYWYSIGTAPGLTDIKSWTDNWIYDTAYVSGLSLITGQTYYFNIKAENGAGLQSSIVSSDGQMVVSPTAIKEQDIIFSGVFPNPSSSEFVLNYFLNKNEVVHIEVTDLIGRTIYSSTNEHKAGKQKHVIGSEKLANGVYVLELKTVNTSYSTRIIKQ